MFIYPEYLNSKIETLFTIFILFFVKRILYIFKQNFNFVSFFNINFTSKTSIVKLNR
jgi:hypothetical protein